MRSAAPLASFGLSRRAAIVCLVVALAIVLGGGGSSAPVSEMLLELAFAPAAIAWLATRRPGDPRCPRAALGLAALILILPIAQSIPLPPALWQALPGRAVERAALTVTGAGDAWMPWTVSPPRTFAALLAMLPPVFVLCAASMLDRAGRRGLLCTIALLGLASLLLGALQLADGIERTWRFYVDNPGYLNGFQASRNAEADVLLIAFAALAALVPGLVDMRGRPLPATAIGALAGAPALLLGCVLTGSRGGIALIVPVLAITLLPWRRRIVRARLAAAATVGLVLLIGVCIVLTQASGGALGLVAARFTWTRDVRLDLWRDTLPVVHAVWPAGSGIGTFRPMFIAGEPLTSVDPSMPVRAHDDYLEFLLEGGIAAAAVIAGYAIASVLLLTRALRCAAPRDRPTVVFVMATLLVIALHSFVDYPLRSMAIAVLGAGTSGMLIGIVRDAADMRAARSAS